MLNNHFDGGSSTSANFYANSLTTKDELKPTACIMINKNRVKHYASEATYITEGYNVYLENGTDFQIELFNPTDTTVLAKFKFNGKSEDGGIVLYPGQRIILERYLNSNNKFHFKTYEVSGSNTAVENAIKDNGELEVSFYKEQIKQYFNQTYIYKNEEPITTSITWDNTNIPMNLYSNDCLSLTCSNENTTLTANYNSTVGNCNRRVLQKKEKKTKETGIIEKGDVSSQTFNEVNKDFEHWMFKSYNFHIKPASQKTINANSPELRRRYCSNCGKKVRYNDKYCSSCGNKL